MKKVNLLISTLGLVILAAPAFAGHGVERILPADAKNVAVSAVTIGSDISSQTLISDGGDGPVYQNNFGPVLSVDVTYQSKDHSDDATALSDSADPYEVVVGGPTLSFNLPVTPAQVIAINAKTLDPKSLVAISVAPAPIQINNPVYTAACHFSNDNGQPDNPECIKNVYTTEVRPVLKVDLK